MSEQTFNRREMLTATAGLAAAAGLTGFSGAAEAQTKRVPGVQLYTVREAMAKDVANTLQAIAGIGYREVEFAGYFTLQAKDVRNLLGDFGLAAPSTHISGEAVQIDPAGFVSHAAEVGHNYVTIAYMQEENRKTIDDYKRWAEVANRLGETCHEHGMRAAYHNHDFEFRPIDGVVPYDVLISETDPGLVDFELDFYWVREAGRDIRDVLATAPGRVTMSHIKDRNVAGHMVDVGDGTIDFAGILADPVAASIRHCFVEHDAPEDPFRSVAASHFVLKSILE
ncbi:MAG: sugar phosphate isomerase/epimerase [Gammaproteobacteria bacterium]|nr:sugar phosphate isomerase/epimerase [Gammaproteobacteria bacterium]MDH5344760.1 sugar phosphate isomerase/epimerase [Gammaproteobacteria bacterium]